MYQASLLMAAILTIFIGGVHSWLGERRLIGPLLAPENRSGLIAKSSFSRGVLRFAWHLTTLAWGGFAVVLIGYGFAPAASSRSFALLAIAATFFLTGGIILWTSRGRHLAWPVFFAMAALTAAPVWL